MKDNKNISGSEEFEIDDPELSQQVSEGVMPDKMSIGAITLWTVLTSVVVVILIVIAVQLYNYFSFQQQYQAAVNVEYRGINELRGTAERNLTTFEVIDDEQGIYRIPIDSAKTILINRSHE